MRYQQCADQESMRGDCLQVKLHCNAIAIESMRGDLTLATHGSGLVEAGRVNMVRTMTLY